MPRLIAFKSADDIPARLQLGVNDVLMFAASGGHVLSGAGAMSMLGAFRPGVAGADGQVLAPEGLPGTVLFRALAPGSAVIDIVRHMPGGERLARQIEIEVMA